jgi:hypothetical protein
MKSGEKEQKVEKSGEIFHDFNLKRGEKWGKLENFFLRTN